MSHTLASLPLPLFRLSSLSSPPAPGSIRIKGKFNKGNREFFHSHPTPGFAQFHPESRLCGRSRQATNHTHHGRSRLTERFLRLSGVSRASSSSLSKNLYNPQSSQVSSRRDDIQISRRSNSKRTRSGPIIPRRRLRE